MVKGKLDLKADKQPEIGHPTGRPVHGLKTDAPLGIAAIAEARMNPGYSYAGDKLKSHINGLDSEQKTMNILDDIIGVIDE
ncbi:MAG: hypothetical protein JW747_02655 [Candidatus Aminicenantes bacterium]|nr:hypothetical protein [Candidatus Aminicenantes bacterium]